MTRVSIATWAFTLALGIADAATAAQEDAAPHDPRIAQLIRELGGATFAGREQASRELIKLGSPARAMLKQALHDPDAEIRLRAAQAAAAIKEALFQAQLEAFAADLDGRHDHTLPCWDQFRKLIGQDRIARSLFVDMQRAEPALLDALEEGNRVAASNLLAVRSRALAQSIQGAAARVRNQVELGHVAALLLVAAAEGVTVDDQLGVQLTNFVYQASIQTAIRSGPQSDLLKKLLGHWIAKDSGDTVGYYNLMLAFTFELPQGLDIALRVLGNAAPQVHIRQYAILAIGRFGNRGHLPLVEPLLKDDTNCFVQQINNQQVQTQVRDVALAVLVHLTGQDLKAYGFSKAQSHTQMLFNPGSLGFADNAGREAAIKKWHSWSAEQKHAK